MYICIKIKKDKMDNFLNQRNNSMVIDPFFSPNAVYQSQFYFIGKQCWQLNLILNPSKALFSVFK